MHQSGSYGGCNCPSSPLNVEEPALWRTAAGVVWYDHQHLKNQSRCSSDGGMLSLGSDLACTKEVANKGLILLLFADSLARPVLQESDEALSLHNRELHVYPFGV